MPSPQDAAPQQGGGDQQQANPLQTILGRLAMAARQIGLQNTVIQPEMQQISSLFVQALQKASQAAPGPAQPIQSPQQQ